jgi:hypothetical protein
MQYSLKKLLLVVPMLGFALALFGVLGIAVVVFLLAQTIWMEKAVHRVSVVLVWAVLFVLASCVVHGHREVHYWYMCRNQLKMIGFALHAYHDAYGQFPPQYVADSEGHAMHSWRVLILPYLSDETGQHVYDQYRFDEPWNSPHNLKLAGQAADLFRCPTTDAEEPDSPLVTHYVAVAGPGTMWPGSTGTRFKDMTDGAARTIALVEIASSDIHWMEPRDMTLDQAIRKGNGACNVPSSRHVTDRIYFFRPEYPLAGNVLMADGSCRMLAFPPAHEDLRAMLSVDGGETIDEDAIFRWHASSLKIDMMRCALFLGLLVSFVLLEW